MIGFVLTLQFIVLIFAFHLFLISTQPLDLVHTIDRGVLGVVSYP